MFNLDTVYLLFEHCIVELTICMVQQDIGPQIKPCCTSQVGCKSYVTICFLVPLTE